MNAKILKDIKFPLDLDVYDLCSTELQEKMTPIRNKFKVYLSVYVNQNVKRNVLTLDANFQEMEEQQVADALSSEKVQKKSEEAKDDGKSYKVEPYSFAEGKYV